MGSLQPWEQQAGSGKAAAKVQLVCPVSGGCRNVSILTGGAAWQPLRGSPPPGEGAGEFYSMIRSLLQGQSCGTARAGCWSRAVTAAFPLRLCSHACSRTGATETIMAVIKKEKEKKIPTPLRAEKPMSLGAIPHPLHPQEWASNIYMFLACELFNQGKAIPEQALFWARRKLPSADRKGKSRLVRCQHSKAGGRKGLKH